ncbi:MAG: SEC-C metal-binding domain-containing protein [Balneolaceae bacterium]|nr:SEC-C metal-binding domain-containing protein [Balneolaceae bacterium]
MSDTPDRNDPCPCGSGRKYKNCCMEKERSSLKSNLGVIGLIIAIILGIYFTSIALSGGDNAQDCPPGEQWSATHQHCH